MTRYDALRARHPKHERSVARVVGGHETAAPRDEGSMAPRCSASRRVVSLVWALTGALVVTACGAEPSPGLSGAARSSVASVATSLVAPTARPSGPVLSSAASEPGGRDDPHPPLEQAYPWLAAPPAGAPAAHEALEQRFRPPSGYRRVALAPGSFGAFLRRLPLAAPGTPVRTYRGAILREASDPRVAAVAALDVGGADLQQCADSVMRLWAEHRFASGELAISFQAASGAALPFSRWLAGERVVVEGNRLRWTPSAKASKPTHRALREYLDAVFAWANTGSLAKTAKVVARESLRPGDFVVVAGNPGHAVLILDVATGPKGERLGLLGQGFMPAQSFHVLRDGRGSPWFVLDGPTLETPFWEPFPWSSLRRLEP